MAGYIPKHYLVLTHFTAGSDAVRNNRSTTASRYWNNKEREDQVFEPDARKERSSTTQPFRAVATVFQERRRHGAAVRSVAANQFRGWVYDHEFGGAGDG